MKKTANPYSQFYAIARAQAFDEETKENMVSLYTNGRTTSLRGMTDFEYQTMVKGLNKAARPSESLPKKEKESQPDSAQTMRGKIFSLCYEMGYMAYSMKEMGRSLTPDEKKINQAVVYGIVLRKGTLKKHLMAYSEPELIQLVSQFETMLKNNIKQDARKEVRLLIAELNLTVR